MPRFCLSGGHYTFQDVMEVLNFQVLQTLKHLCLLTMRQRHHHLARCLGSKAYGRKIQDLQDRGARFGPRCGGVVSSEQLRRGRERKKVGALATLGGGDYYSVLSFRTQAIVTVKQVSPWWPDGVTGGFTL